MRHESDKWAKEVSEMLLNITGDALLSGDFDTFARCFRLPHTIETADSKRFLQTRADMRIVFNSVVDDYRRRRVTDLVRICDVAEFKSPTKIKAMHTTHLMSGQLRVIDPYPCYSVLEYIDDQWLSTSSQYAVDEHTTVGRAIATPPLSDTVKA